MNAAPTDIQKRRTPATLWIATGLLFGLMIVMILTYGIMRSWLLASTAEQQKELQQLISLSNQQLAEMNLRWSSQQQELQQLKVQIEEFKPDRIQRNAVQLSRLQKKLDDHEKEFLARIAKLENRLTQSEELGKQMNQSLLNSTEKAEKYYNEQKEQLRLLKNSLADIENKINQLQRQTSSPAH